MSCLTNVSVCNIADLSIWLNAWWLFYDGSGLTSNGWAKKIYGQKRLLVFLGYRWFNINFYPMNFFWILWGFDALIALVVLYFFFIGLADGSVSSNNLGLWTLLLIALAAIMFGSIWLQNHQYIASAKGLLCVLAVPGLLAGLFMVIILITNPRWN